ncbi:MAG: 5'/3'-nucleotidase SurE [Chitinivibrionales bacterium]|nr:5'/3'-nucleotidase SurE [Chitinivibrionales bacterium]
MSQSTSPRPTVLLTNDDGFEAPGIRMLYAALSRYFAVITAAPITEQSGVSHAFTYFKPLYCKVLDGDSPLQGFAVGGTPSDCIKLAVSTLLERKPEIIVSGMNIGENSGVSGYYSGTVAAAREGAFWQLPSFAFSVCEDGREHLTAYCERAVDILHQLLAVPDNEFVNEKNRIFFNINFPACKPSAVRGVKACRQSMAWFNDCYKAVRGADGEIGYEIYGAKQELESSNDYDSCALQNDFITITPLHFDASAEAALPALARIEDSCTK